MRCSVCRNKFTVSPNRCRSLPSCICERCAIKGLSTHQCDMSCFPEFPPKIESYPLGNSVIGLSPMGEIKGTEEDFFPAIYNYILCEVEYVKIVLEELHQLHVSIEFQLFGSPELEKQIFRNEGWKYMHISDALKDRGLEKTYLAQVLALYLWSGLRVVEKSLKLSIDQKETIAIVNPNVDFIGLPNCFPPDKKNQTSQQKQYSYYLGKFALFYAPFCLNKKYHLEFDVEAINFHYETGILFPYKNVEIRKYLVSGNSNILPSNILYQRIDPYISEMFPPQQQYHWFREIGKVDRPPMITPADPFRETKLLGVPQEPKRFENNIPSFSLKDFTLVRSSFWPALMRGKDTYCKVKITDSPLPIRVFDQMQRLPRYRDFLIEYDIVNFSSNSIDVEIMSEIVGITDKFIGNFTIPGIKNRDGKPARIIECQSPNLKFGIMETIINPIEATLSYQINIIKIDGERKLIEQGTKIVKILPHDVILWTVNDSAGNSVYDLSKMIGSWVTPNDSQGVLDEIRGKAKEYHPSRVLIGNQAKTLEDINLQIKAIYDYLNKESGISYVEQSSFKYCFNSGGQRILLPERVVKAKTGNCIDLTVLFASLMEGLGINPLLLLTSNHAFLGWGNKYDKDKMGFLECTFLGISNPNTNMPFTFEEAFIEGKRKFLEEFILVGSNQYIPLHSVTFGKDGPQIIDLSEVRKEGIKRI